MFINKCNSYHFIDDYGRTFQRTTTYGKYKNVNIAIDNYRYKGKKIFEKRYVLWTDTWQKVVNKICNKDGKFERVG